MRKSVRPIEPTLTHLKRPKAERKVVQALKPEEVNKLLAHLSSKTFLDIRNRAIVMMLLGKAELIIKLERSIRTINSSFPLPSVLRLINYVKSKRKEITLTRRKIIERDRHQCQYCGRTTGQMTTDHIIPKSNGGTDGYENLQLLHAHCHHKKSAQENTKQTNKGAHVKS